MKRSVRTMVRASGAGVALLALVAAVRPAVFTQTTGGLWEVSRPNGGRRNICLADPTVLAQYEHLRANCSRDVIRNQASRAEIHYTCQGGALDRKSTRLNSSHSQISYAVFCLKKKTL